MATDQYLIVMPDLASAASEAKRTLSRRPAVHVDCRAVCHGLSTLIGAVRPLLCSDGLELSDANYITVGAMIWPSWHRRRSRMEVDGADEKCSCVLYSYL